MAFNVGSGVLQKMAELNDNPAWDSKFINSIDGKSRAEKGYGIKYWYRAVGHLQTITWQWQVYAYNYPIVTTPSTGVIDMRGKLPKRTPTSVYPLRDVSKVDMLCVHYTAAPPERTVEDIARYQTTVQTGDLFPEIAYHMFIEKDGKLIWCHDVNKRTWGSGQPGMNERAFHVCYSGNVAPNDLQIQALNKSKQFLVYSLLEGRQVIVQGHKDGYATQCPGPTWDTWKHKIL